MCKVREKAMVQCRVSPHSADSWIVRCGACTPCFDAPFVFFDLDLVFFVFDFDFSVTRESDTGAVADGCGAGGMGMGAGVRVVGAAGDRGEAGAGAELDTGEGTSCWCESRISLPSTESRSSTALESPGVLAARRCAI
jgi:hypothetical protein